MNTQPTRRNSLYLLAFVFLLAGLSACTENGAQADAYGNFEADDLLVSAELPGKIIEFNVEEGQVLKAGQQVGRLDSTQLVLKKEQLLAAIQAIKSKSPAIAAQLAVFEKQKASTEQQLSTLDTEKARIERLLKSDAATPKQLDDLTAQMDLLHRQIAVINEQQQAAEANLSVQKNGLLAEVLPLQKQIDQIEDQIERCRIINPIEGTVLNTYAERGEVTAPGKPLYRVAKLNPIVLRAYFGGDQLSSIKIGQTVRVAVDGPDDSMKEFTGTISWISEKAEFTPKVIQTKDERVNLVYACKILVENDGSLKIGMPAEVYGSAPAESTEEN
jgi:HlyD family secretion protein